MRTKKPKAEMEPFTPVNPSEAFSDSYFKPKIGYAMIQRQALRDLQQALGNPYFGSISAKKCIAIIEEWLQ